MAKSTRITDDLCELALQDAAVMKRSLAQQIEHADKLGVGMENAKGAKVEDVRAASLRYRHLRDEAAVRSGKKAPESLYAIPASIVKNARLEYPSGAFATRRKSW